MRRSGQRGFTLIEIVVSLAIVGIFVVIISGTLTLALTQGPKHGAQLNIEGQQMTFRYWLQKDANSAQGFTQSVSPTYGTFTWQDFSPATTVTYQARYYYDGTLDAVMRELSQDTVVQDTFQVASGVLAEGNAVFTLSTDERYITVVLTNTVEEAPGVGDVARTGTHVGFFRYLGEQVLTPPGPTPTNTPNQVPTNNPVIVLPAMITGSYVSGAASSLTTNDNNFHVASSQLCIGTQTVAWEAAVTITSPVTIDSLITTFRAKANVPNVTLKFYVKTASGYNASPDWTFLMTQSGREKETAFDVPPTYEAYINAQDAITVKVEATASLSFQLSSDEMWHLAVPP